MFKNFEKFLVVWTISNFAAIRSVNSLKGKVFCYESLVTKPELVKQIFEEQGIKFDIDQIKLKNILSL